MRSGDACVARVGDRSSRHGNPTRVHTANTDLVDNRVE
jgi:hypothetical protein